MPRGGQAVGPPATFRRWSPAAAPCPSSPRLPPPSLLARHLYCTVAPPPPAPTPRSAGPPHPPATRSLLRSPRDSRFRLRELTGRAPPPRGGAPTPSGTCSAAGHGDRPPSAAAARRVVPPPPTCPPGVSRPLPLAARLSASLTFLLPQFFFFCSLSLFASFCGRQGPPPSLSLSPLPASASTPAPRAAATGWPAWP